MAKQLFSFTAQPFQGHTLDVVRFNGHEAISDPYLLDITLMGRELLDNCDDCIGGDATFTLHGQDNDLTLDTPIHGVLILFEVLQQTHKHTFYRAVIRPRLWSMTISCGNQIFLNKTVPEFLKETLVQQGLVLGTDFEFRLAREYPRRDFVCQYNESHFDFISRWMEREGIYFFFEQGDSREKAIFTDSSSSHTDFPGASPLHYAPTSGLEKGREQRTVWRWARMHSLVPRTVLLQDYNYRTPGLKISAEKTVSKNGIGMVHAYADNIKTPSEAEALATVRAQEKGCREITATAESAAVSLRSGYTFTLQDHYENSWNQKWLTIAVGHEGSQEGYLFSGLDQREAKQSFFYHNTVTAIPENVQFRPECTHDWPRMHGAMNAHIDAEGSGHYAELDAQGRYKVTMPLDISGRKGGHASSWIRMAQPYGGGDHGMHFPLHKSTEVMLTYVNGDPDRPIIAGSVPDPQHASVVTSQSQTQSKITTGGQNKLHIEDKAGSQRMLMSAPTADSYGRIGSHNDPPPDWSDSEEIAGWKLNTSKMFEVQAGSKNSVILGNNFKTVIGWEHRETLGIRTSTVLGLNLGIYLAYLKEFAPLENKLHQLAVRLGISKTKMVEEHVKTADEVFEAAEEKMKEVGKETKVVAQKTSLAASKTKMAASKTSLAESKVKLAQSKNDVAQNKVRISNSDIGVMQSKQTVMDEKVRLSATNTHIAQSHSDAAQRKTILAGAQMVTAQEESLVCDQVTHVAAEQNES